MVVRYKDKNGQDAQKSRSTKIRVEGSTPRQTRQYRRSAEKLLDEWIAQLESDPGFQLGDRSELYLTDCVDQWIERRKSSIRLDTYEAYRSYFDAHIQPYFGPKRLKLADVVPRDLQRFIDAENAAGSSANSIKKYLVPINGALKEAAQYREIPFNPCVNLTLPKAMRFKGKAYSKEQANELLRAVRRDPIEPAVYLGLFLGLRRSEVAGLRWADVDLEKGTVEIRNTVVRFCTLSEAERTKSEASRRTLTLPGQLKEYLIQRKQTMEVLKAALGTAFHDSGHVCQWQNGEAYKPEYITRRFKRILEIYHLPEIRFHDLRHTAGSLLISGGQKINYVQKFLGHEKASTTLDIYTHTYKEEMHQTAEIIDSILSTQGTNVPGMSPNHSDF